MGWFGGGNDNLQGGSSTDGFSSDLGDGTANQYGGSSNFASGSEGGGNPLVSQVQQELATAYAQEFFSTVRDKCFQKCITKPGSSLSSGDQNCLARCCDRYIDATKVVSQSVLQTAQSGAQ